MILETTEAAEANRWRGIESRTPMKWNEQSWSQIADFDKETVVVIPLGSCEQHGRHLPLFVDSIQVEELARRVDEKLGRKILTLPVLWLGSSHHHLDFPGTVSVTPDLFGQMIQSITHCILKAGFRRLFFLNGHGGNEPPAVHALSQLAVTSDAAEEAQIVVGSWWKIASGALDPQKLGMATPGLSHACEYETSCLLAIRGDLVRMGEVREGDQTVQSPWAKAGMSGKLNGFRRFRRWTSSGAMGTPAAATREKGEQILDGVADLLAGVIEDFGRWPELEVIGPQR